jgi:hypothetical protein
MMAQKDMWLTFIAALYILHDLQNLKGFPAR